MQRVSVIDSHTAGEPTRTVISGFPSLGTGSMAERREIFSRDFDAWRQAIVNEPRGSDVLVGALLQEPVDPANVCGAIFFNNVGMLGMCGHATIGLIVTLAWLGRIQAGSHVVETPVGNVTATLHADGTVTVENVPSYREAAAVAAAGVTGDIAWSGNWFYLCADHGMEVTLANVPALTVFAQRVRDELNAGGYPLVDHVELIGKASPGADSRNFVLCPGGAYDRSPCGTGTSARLACLAAAGELAPGEVYVQESIIGSRFTGTYQQAGDHIIPSITGPAWVNAEAVLLLDPADPCCWGIRPGSQESPGSTAGA